MGFSPQRLLNILQEFPQTPRYWVAYSGGMDSAVLLRAMADLRDQLNAPLQALHLDHGLQADSRAWSAHCSAFCSALGVPLAQRRLDLNAPPGTSLEAEARAARQEAYRRIIGAGDLLLTAQHRDDQAETVLLQLLRGSGLRGLAAMPALAPLPPGWLARPLLDFTRAELSAYAQVHRVPWIEDPSNADTGFDRNYLRHRVLPLITTRWPGFSRTLSRSARHCAEAQGLIDATAERELNGMGGTRAGSLSVAALARSDCAERRMLLRHWITAQGFRPPSERCLGRVMSEVLQAAPDRIPLVAWAGAEVRRYRDDLYVIPPLPERPPHSALPWDGAGALDLPCGLGRLLPFVAAPGHPGVRRGAAELKVRFGVTGLHCRQVGRPHRSLLKKLYQERAVPPWLRPFVPLVFRADRMVAVGGLWRCATNGGAALPGEIRWVDHPWTAIIGGA